MTRCALVLGGGGVTGIAWELGLLAGLVEAGVDLTTADLLVGTSAGAAVCAQVASGEPVETLYQRQLERPTGEVTTRFGPALIVRLGWASLTTRDPRRFRAKIGAMARAAKTVPEQQWREVIARRLPQHDWPARDLKVTAVDTESGEFTVFHRQSGVPLVDAVAASCAVPGVWPSVTINGRRYFDGGFRSATNADLAAGYDRVVIVAPLARGFGHLTGVAKHLPALAPARVAVEVPDSASQRAIGSNVLDPNRRAPSAQAGRAQAGRVREEIERVWLAA